jgi:hypothetical protein
LTFGTVAPAFTFQTARTTVVQTAVTTVICRSGQAVCNGLCTDITGDSANCGGCGNRCYNLNSTCYQGHCWGSCAGTPGPVNINTDPLNCGGCGNACPVGQVCYNGNCRDSIPQGWDTLCEFPDYYTPPRYTNLQADRQNCGRCGNDCGDNGSCIFGTCSYACTNPDGTVVHPNFNTDNQHCGQCGNACGTGSHCMEGACMQDCPTGEYRRCPPDNSCTKIDELNCHACGDACSTDEYCWYNPYSPQHYSCRCLPGYSAGQDGSCVRFGTPEHCEGQSGTPCPAGYSCLLTGSIYTGRCLPSCPSGYEDCGGTCRNPETDPDNCGGCGNV